MGDAADDAYDAAMWEDDEPEIEDEPCDCSERARPDEYYHCPKCDAEGHPEEPKDTPHMRTAVERAGLWANLPENYSGSGTLAAFEAGKRAATDAILRLVSLGGWRPISEHDGSDAPVDLIQNGERLTDFIWRGRWEKKHGYPTKTTVLMTPPSHFMASPAPPSTQEAKDE